MSYFNFNDLTELMWGKFNRPFKEVNRYQLYKKEGKGYVMVVNALGIKKEDIKVSLVPAEASQEKYPRLTITGSTETPYIEDKYSIDISMLLLIKEKIEVGWIGYYAVIRRIWRVSEEVLPINYVRVDNLSILTQHLHKIAFCRVKWTPNCTSFRQIPFNGFYP